MENVAEELERLAWFDTWDPMCLTLVEGIDADEVLRRFGGDPEATRPMTSLDYWDRQDGGELRHFVGVGEAGGLVFALEENGWTGNVPGVLRSLSREGRALCLYTHINAADGVGYAVGGDLVVYEEPWGPPTPLNEGDPRWDPAWCDGLADEANDVWLRGANILVMAQRVMGVHLSEDWFTGPRRSCEIPSPDRFANTDAWTFK